MVKYLVKLIIFNTLGKCAALFFSLLVNKNKTFIINYHTTYPEFNKNFLKQITFFRKYFDIVDSESIKNIKLSKKPKLILTFDDAHVSNFQISKILKKENIPFSDYGTTFAKEWHQVFFHDPEGNVVEVHQNIK